MTTIPARLATLTRTSHNAPDARRRLLKLYRDWYRSAPEICTLYALSVSPAYVRHAIRQKFEKFHEVTDPRAIDVLLLKGRQDYQETMNCWKQTDHVLGILLESKERPNKTFLQKFYEGRDEEAIRPAASGV
ncbi:hypothetical protein M413DRAFT_18755 [Hebeloma cylindrosporum]|uniref:Complex 1 LYR protein domain-containing protein n=1 Tax=Hebeloma cylindrosporum TaxID=76867 RepID=A0A0C2XVZ1_HEBCY|nr:hypothetical protein M413DRAFT_18755 [Hebeloma cylindrosporum h7]